MIPRANRSGPAISGLGDFGSGRFRVWAISGLGDFGSGRFRVWAIWGLDDFGSEKIAGESAPGSSIPRAIVSPVPVFPAAFHSQAFLFISGDTTASLHSRIADKKKAGTRPAVKVLGEDA
jgi:hypothetical protein